MEAADHIAALSRVVKEEYVKLIYFRGTDNVQVDIDCLKCKDQMDETGRNSKFTEEKGETCLLMHQIGQRKNGHCLLDSVRAPRTSGSKVFSSGAFL